MWTRCRLTPTLTLTLTLALTLALTLNPNPSPNPNPNEVPETLVKDDEGNLPDANMEMRRRFEANCRRAQDEICKAVEELDGSKFQQAHRLRGRGRGRVGVGVGVGVG